MGERSRRSTPQPTTAPQPAPAQASWASMLHPAEKDQQIESDGRDATTHNSFIGNLMVDMEQVDAFDRYEPQHDHGHLEGFHDLNGNGIRDYGEERTGFIDPNQRRDPTWRDRMAKRRWLAKLVGARVLRPDLEDATDRYAHFLRGSGETYEFDYAKLFAEQSRSEQTRQLSHRQAHAQALAYHDSGAMGCGLENLRFQSQFTEQTTAENWTKAIGRHNLFIGSEVGITMTPEGRLVESNNHFIADDQYNFNPNEFDVRSGIPDNENGRFEQTGLAREFRQIGTAESRETELIPGLLPPGYAPRSTE